MTTAKSNPGAISGLLNSLKGLNDVLGAVQAPLESAGRTGILEPIQAGIKKLGQLVSDHLAAPDIEPTAQQKRLATLTGIPVARQYPKGIDWKVHKADVQNTVEGINSGLEALYSAGLMTAEGKALGPTTEPGVAPLSDPELNRVIRGNRRS